MAALLHKQVPVPGSEQEAKNFAKEYFEDNLAPHLLCLGIEDGAEPYGLKILSVNGHGQSSVFAAYLCSMLQHGQGAKCEGVMPILLGRTHRTFIESVLRRFRIYNDILGPHRNKDALHEMWKNVRRAGDQKSVIVLRFDPFPPDLDTAPTYVRAAELALQKEQSQKKAA